MAKSALLQLFFVLCAAVCLGQKATRVTIATTTGVREALRICKDVGETQRFFTDDYNDTASHFSFIGSMASARIQLKISASSAGQKTLLVLSIPHVHMVGGYTGVLKTYTKGLKDKLANIETGQYEVIRE